MLLIGSGKKTFSTYHMRFKLHPTHIKKGREILRFFLLLFLPPLLLFLPPTKASPKLDPSDF